jgi:hypothetical protein
LLAVGNVGSMLYPRPVDPAQSWRASTGSRFQAWLLIIYPLASLPILASFLIRNATKSEAAFYLVLLLAWLAGLALYRWAMAYAVRSAEEKREEIAGLLAATQAPIAEASGPRRSHATTIGMTAGIRTAESTSSGPTPITTRRARTNPAR